MCYNKLFLGCIFICFVASNNIISKQSFASVDSELIGKVEKDETQNIKPQENGVVVDIETNNGNENGITSFENTMDSTFKEQIEEAQEVKQIEKLNKIDMKNTASRLPKSMFEDYDYKNFTINKNGNKKTSSKFKLSVTDMAKTKDGGSLKMMQEAYSRYKQQDYELSLLYYKRALFYNPQSIEAMFGVGVCYQQLLQYDQAIEAYLKILSNNFSRKKIVSNLFLALTHKTNKDALDILLSIDKKILGYSDILTQIGILYMKNGDNGKAMSSLSRAYELSPTNAIISYNLGLLYDREKNIDYAKHFYEQSIKNDILDLISNEDGVLLQDRISQINQQIIQEMKNTKKK